MSVIDSAPSPRSLVFVEHAGAVVLAVVRESSRGQVKVVTETGERLTVSLGKIVSNPGYPLKPTKSGRTDADAVKELRRRIDDASQELDLETIWQLVCEEETGPVTVGDLAALWFGEPDAEGFFATEQALRRDVQYFKRRKDRYQARSSAEVEAMSRQIEAEARRTAVRDGFIEAVLDALSRSEGAERAVLRADHEFRSMMDLLLDFATYGDAFDRRADAIRLLEALDAKASDRRIRASAIGAFELLLALEFVDEHENLALRRNSIRVTFDTELREQAAQLAAAPQPTHDEQADFTDLDVITIDDTETRDLDDAIHVERLRDGSVEVGIHITDVAGSIDPESPLDLEARRRGASVYLPTGVIPMFPRVLSEDRFSLLAGRDRPALSYLVQIDPSGRPIDRRLRLSRINVKARLSYDDADAILETPGHPRYEMLSDLKRIAEAQRERRSLAGSVDIELPDVRVRVVEGDVELSTFARSDARLVIAEMAVLAGETAALICRAEQIPSVYRTQNQMLDETELTRAFEISDHLARQISLVRLLKRGELHSEPAPHLGLGLDAYVQSTSPIRRYADLIVSYQLRQFLLGRPLIFDDEEIVALAARAEAGAVSCQNAQRDTDRYWRLEYLRRTAPKRVDAVVLDYDSRSSRRSVPIILTETMLRTNLAAQGLEVGQHIEVRPIQIDPRRDQLRVDRL